MVGFEQHSKLNTIYDFTSVHMDKHKHIVRPTRLLILIKKIF